MDSENIFTGFAELTPSYRREQDTTFKSQPAPPSGAKDDSKTNTQNERKANFGKYVADMSEPRTYLANVLPQLLQLRIPKPLSQIIRERAKVKPTMTDHEMLATMGFVTKARPGSRYRLTYRDGCPTILFEDEKKSQQVVTGSGLRFILVVICENIVNDLCTQLRDATVWQSRAFAALSRKMTYNPFYKVAALLPIMGSQSIPASLGLILMDQKLSLVVLSFMLRMTAMPKDLRTKYDNIEYNVPGGAVQDVTVDGRGDPIYNIVVASGIYERVKVRWDGMIRKEREDVKRHNPILFSAETCSWE